MKLISNFCHHPEVPASPRRLLSFFIWSSSFPRSSTSLSWRPLRSYKIFIHVESLEFVFKTCTIQVARVTDMEKAVVTTTEEEEGEELLMVEVVGLQATSIEVEETGEAGHHNRDPKGGTF